MLNEGNSDILTVYSQQYFKGTNVQIKWFWSDNKDIIKKKLDSLEGNSKYKVACETVKVWFFKHDLDDRIDAFIEMLNEGNKDVLSNRNKLLFKGTNIRVGAFWQSYKDKIIQRLFVDLKDNHSYDTARMLIREWQVTYDVE